MTTIDPRQQARERIWAHLRIVGRPDSRFGWNFAEFIADYEGSDEGAALLTTLPEYQAAKLLFITPDNNMNGLRERCIRDGKPFLMTTYSINRGFLYLEPGMVPAGMEKLASTLDGIELFARPMTLPQVKAQFSQIDLMVTGGSAVTLDGLRFGKGHGYFDLEWAIFYEIGVVSLTGTTIISKVHDCQVVDFPLTPSEFDTVADYLVTPTRIIPVKNQLPKPTRGVIWEKLEPDMLGRIPPLQELRAMKGLE